MLQNVTECYRARSSLDPLWGRGPHSWSVGYVGWDLRDLRFCFFCFSFLRYFAVLASHPKHRGRRCWSRTQRNILLCNIYSDWQGYQAVIKPDMCCQHWISPSECTTFSPFSGTEAAVPEYQLLAQVWVGLKASNLITRTAQAFILMTSTNLYSRSLQPLHNLLYSLIIDFVVWNPRRLVSEIWLWQVDCSQIVDVLQPAS